MIRWKELHDGDYYCEHCGSGKIEATVVKGEFSDADGNRGVDILYLYCQVCQYEVDFRLT